MRKIVYSKLNWKARTNWEFCGTKENLMEVWERASNSRGVRLPLAEFGYHLPNYGFAYEKGDVVSYSGIEHTGFAVVDTPVNSNGFFVIRLADGRKLHVNPSDIGTLISIAEIPEELMLLARAEAGKPLDLSKCPLKDAGTCMQGD